MNAPTLATAGRPCVRTRLVDRLIAHRTPQGLWEGRLSSSALATAVSAFALHRAAAARHAEPVARAMAWLVKHANADGGWGDSPDCPSNLSTTLLSRAALTLADPDCSDVRAKTAAAEQWIADRIQPAGAREAPLAPERIVAAVLETYGKDRTFSAPILTFLALAGSLGPPATAWTRVPQLPFELAALPASGYRWLRLPVVSYALPALIAIGLVRHRARPGPLKAWNRLRDRLTPRLLERLERLQPSGGGFLEAAPLTAFVVLSLCAAGATRHPVVDRGVAFLLGNQRPDGSWPIDTRLDTWVTTQIVEASMTLPIAFREHLLPPSVRAAIRDHLLKTQCTELHPYTEAQPGGWAWTALAGGVPDADDTAGALVALWTLTPPEHPLSLDVVAAVSAGLRWLLTLQNRDGGMPTFCRGWGALPFDRSSPDLTAHALIALQHWSAAPAFAGRADLRRAERRALRYLARTQHADGCWTPLWFGNPRAPDARNRTYGTARVIEALSARPADDMCRRGEAWLLANRNADGGWGAARGVPSTLEETGLALRALARLRPTADPVIVAGRDWIDAHTPADADPPAAPIGLYFASLWYQEALYPLCFAVGGC